MTGDRERIIIRSYLMSQVKEFTAGANRIFESLGLENTELLNSILFDIADNLSIYYLEYLEGRIGIHKLKLALEREIGIIYRALISRSGVRKLMLVHPDKIKELEARRLQFLYFYAELIFFNFEDDREELKMIFDRAKTLAKRKGMHPAQIFKYFREELISLIYDADGIKLRLQKLFSFFSVKENLEKLCPSEDDAKIEAVLEEKRSRTDKMHKMTLSLEKFINQRTAEIISAHRA